MWVLFLHREVGAAEEREGDSWSPCGVQHLPCSLHIPENCSQLYLGLWMLWVHSPVWFGHHSQVLFGKSIQKTRIRTSVAHGGLDTEKGLLC